MGTYTENYINRADDICHNRHGGNEQSNTANKMVNKDNDRALVLKFITEHKTAYSKQIARYLGKQLNCISGWLSELKADNPPLIIETGDRKEGCAVYKIKDNWHLF
jgi:hypothetical protein